MARRHEEIAVSKCSSRDICPIGKVCGLLHDGDERPLFPTLLEIEKGEMLWTDLRSEQRVFIIRSGLFVCMAHFGDDEREIPFSLIGRSQAIGMAELYVKVNISDAYHLKAITSGAICSVPANALRRKLERVGGSYPQTVLSYSLTNQTTASLILSKINTLPLIRDRILALLIQLRSMSDSESESEPSFSLTHDDISVLVAADRTSTTRTLHKLRDDGLVELGYKSITLKSSINEQGVALPVSIETLVQFPERYYNGRTGF